MSAKRVILKNNHTETYDQWIKGEHIVIKPGEEIKLDRRDAINIRGHYAQKHDAQANQWVGVECNLQIIPIDEEPESKDVVENAVMQSDLLTRLEKLESIVNKPAKVYACYLCDREFTSSEGLKTHIGRVHKNESGGLKE